MTTPLTKRRVVLDLVTSAPAHAAMYGRPDDDAASNVTGLPVIYMSAEDFRALGEREQITITIEPGDQLNDGVDEAEEVSCPNCGRNHIPDEGDSHTTCVECQDGRGDDE